jgi:hypothetical protein
MVVTIIKNMTFVMLIIFIKSTYYIAFIQYILIFT